MSYSNATFYVDDGSVSGNPGDDSARAALTSCTASNPSGTITRINKTGHGLATGAVVDLTGFDAWLNGAWKITVFNADNFDLDGATWQSTVDASGTVTPRGGSSWADAWETISDGPLAARIQPGDTIRVAKSGDPVSVGGATWTGGPIGAEVSISSSTNATPIVVTTSTNHGLNNGDYIRVYDHTTNTTANGTWKVANKTLNTFQLTEPETGANSVGVGVGSGGKVRKINSQVVYLDTAQTKTVDNCESVWTLTGGYVNDSFTITAGGKGYTPGDILTINSGPADATVEVLTVETTGPVLTVSVSNGGTGYTPGDILTIAGGDNNATVTVLTIGAAPYPVLTVSVTSGGTGYATGTFISTTGAGSGCQLNILNVDDGDVLTVQLDTQSVLGGYTAGSGKATTYGGAGTGCTLGISVSNSGTLTLDTPSGQSPQSAAHVTHVVDNIIVAGAAAARLAYKAITSTDFSSYDSLTLWVKSNGTSPLAVDEFRVCLCSDTTGQTVVDTFLVPALPAQAKWYPLVIQKSGGGSLGAAIQSIALYSDTATQAGAYLSVDNISACDAAGLNLHTLITKNTQAFGGTEYTFAIESISGRVVMLAERAGSTQFAPSGSSAKRGYIGTTENVTTYLRKPVALPVASGSANIARDNGIYGSTINYSGGWDTVSNTQNGVTIYDGQIGNGSGLYCSRAYNTFTRFHVTRYSSGFHFEDAGSFRNTVTDITATHCNQYGVLLSEGNNNTVTSARVNYCSTGAHFSSCSNNTITSISAINCSAGVEFSACLKNTVQAITANYCDTGASFYSTATGNALESGTFTNCDKGVQTYGGENYGRGLTFSSCNENVYAYPASRSRRFDSKNHNGTGQNYLFDVGVEVVSAPTTRSGGAGLMWGITLTSLLGPYRDEGFPFYLPIAQVPVEANALVTASLWMKKTDSTDIAASFICKGGQIAGVTTDVETVKASNTAWQNVIITFTPTERGVVELGAKVWFVTSTPETVYIDDITISQAV